MLIIFLDGQLNTVLQAVGQYQPEPSASGGLVYVVIGQQGVYQLAALLDEVAERNDIALYVLKRDLITSGLLALFETNTNLNIIGFEDFVTLSIQHQPCITLQ